MRQSQNTETRTLRGASTAVCDNGCSEFWRRVGKIQAVTSLGMWGRWSPVREHERLIALPENRGKGNQSCHSQSLLHQYWQTSYAGSTKNGPLGMMQNTHCVKLPRRLQYYLVCSLSLQVTAFQARSRACVLVFVFVFLLLVWPRVARLRAAATWSVLCFDVLPAHVTRDAHVCMWKFNKRVHERNI